MQATREKYTRGTKDFPFEIYRHNVEKAGTVVRSLHFHTEIEILFVKKGTINVRVLSEEFVLEEGTVCFINPEEPHAISTVKDNTVYFAAVFSPTLISFNVGHFFNKQFTAPLLKGEITLPRVMTDENSELVDKIFSSESKTMILSNLITLFSLLIENSLIKERRSVSTDKHSEDIKNITEYIGEHFSERLTLSFLAKRLHFSNNYFCSFFKKYTGMKIFEYLNHIRIQKACELLKETKKPIAEIAEECGFESPSFFIRKFKELQGCTPGNYRKAQIKKLLNNGTS